MPRLASRLEFEVKNIQHHIAAAVHEDDVSSENNMGAPTRRRRQAALKLLRARKHLLPQAGWQGSPDT
jgi:hypothetical protein